MMKIVALLLVGCAVTAQAGILPTIPAIPAIPAIPDVGALVSSKIGASVGAGIGGGAGGRDIGPVNQLLDGVVAAGKGLVGGLKPAIAGLLNGLIPLIKAILEGLQINVCAPKSETEKIVHQAKHYLETDLHKQLDIPKLEGLCKPGEEGDLNVAVSVEVPEVAEIEGTAADVIEDLAEGPEEIAEEVTEKLPISAAAKLPISSSVKLPGR